LTAISSSCSGCPIPTIARWFSQIPPSFLNHRYYNGISKSWEITTWFKSRFMANSRSWILLDTAGPSLSLKPSLDGLSIIMLYRVSGLLPGISCKRKYPFCSFTNSILVLEVTSRLSMWLNL
jgi:hypothetical protein